MIKRSSDRIREEKRKSFFLKEIAKIIHGISAEEADLLLVYPTKVEFSPGGGTCYVYFAGHSGKEDFDKALEILKLYRPSLRRALARIRQTRYTPDLMFKYDESVDRSRRINSLLDDVKEELGDEHARESEGSKQSS